MLSKLKRPTALAAAGLVGCALFMGATSVANADTSTTVVRPSALDGWNLDADTRGQGTYTFTDSSGLQLSTTDSSDKVAGYRAVTGKLSDVTSLGYTTTLVDPNESEPRALPSYQIVLDYNGPDVAGGFDTLVGEPVYNTWGDTADKVAGTHTWDMFDGGNAIWWSTHTIPGATSPNEGGAYNDTYVPISQIMADNPDAVVQYIGYSQGSGAPSLTADVDHIVYNGHAWDFRPDLVNHNPVATDDTNSTTSGAAVTTDVLANDSDADGDTLTVQSVSDAVNGVATINDNKVEYTPNADFVGKEVLNYVAADGQGGTATGKLTIQVSAPPAPVANQAPVAKDDTLNVLATQYKTLIVLKNDSDPDGDELTVLSVSTPDKGYADVYDNVVSYSSFPGASGTDSFTVKITDGQGHITTSTVNVNITAVKNVVVWKDKHHPGTLHARNKNDLPMQFLYGKRSNPQPDGRLKIAPHSTITFKTQRTSVYYIGLLKRGTVYAGDGVVKNIRQ